MPRGRRSFSAEEAQHVLEQLIKEGRIKAAEISRYREIRELEQRLESLRGGVIRRVGGWRKTARRLGRRVRSSAITAGQLASRQLQGRYLALIRQIPANRRAHYGRIAKKKSREAAIRAMQMVVGGRASATKGGRRRRRSSKVTAEQLASRKLQGRYLALVRQIPASQRGRYAKIAKDRGREAAIKEMQSALGK